MFQLNVTLLTFNSAAKLFLSQTPTRHCLAALEVLNSPPGKQHWNNQPTLIQCCVPAGKCCNTDMYVALVSFFFTSQHYCCGLPHSPECLYQEVLVILGENASFCICAAGISGLLELHAIKMLCHKMCSCAPPLNYLFSTVLGY